MVSITVATSPEAQGGGDERGCGRAVGQGHRRPDCKITAMAVTNQQSENAPTGGKRSLIGSPLGLVAYPSPWSWRLGWETQGGNGDHVGAGDLTTGR